LTKNDSASAGDRETVWKRRGVCGSGVVSERDEQCTGCSNKGTVWWWENWKSGGGMGMDVRIVATGLLLLFKNGGDVYKRAV
jgi:hypothetical protein